MFIPYAVDVPFDHRPVLNWLVCGVLVVIFVVQIAAIVGEVDHGLSAEEAFQKTMGRFILDGWGLSGLFGYMGYTHCSLVCSLSIRGQHKEKIMQKI